MFIGHYSVSFLAKRIEPQLPLWVLFLAVQFVDIVWSILIFAGVEQAHVSRALPGSPLELTYMPFTHSLLGAVCWSAAAYLLIRYTPLVRGRNARMGLVVAAAVFSHWVLDLIVHQNDLPLWLDRYKVGFGLYQSAFGSFLTESVLLAIGFLVFLRIRSKTQTRHRVGFVVFLVLMLLFGFNSVYGVTPPNTQTAAGFLLVSYLFFAVMIAILERRAAGQADVRTGGRRKAAL